MITNTSTLTEMKLNNEQEALMIQTMKVEHTKLCNQMAQLDELLLRLENKINRLDDCMNFTPSIQASA
ncbi:MAG: hypothetical protein ACE3L7_09645 [Candidatus Pristimantibacillus sp.]|jgi:hypothetical protein|uniref:Uncharacterized protein n=1 Tax=Paenibacillus baimaensis TaxID=2982185 RepID=A0ABT2UIP9_9BACL|nr:MULTISPECIES: hypothetical protein [unclassified Paenibacillus]MCU6794520.1 hypothetical protein [Paenibacillus sp. WQ 127069]OMF19375.1 hypothetical protein BK127_05265 [Paenibacillus sp. FSL H7-0331]